MPDPSLIQFPPNEPPQKDERRFIFLADALQKIASHIEDLSTLLYENQDRFNHDPLIQGLEALLGSYASTLDDMANNFRGSAAENYPKGGAQ
jgi:hypothetical protein